MPCPSLQRGTAGTFDGIAQTICGRIGEESDGQGWPAGNIRRRRAVPFRVGPYSWKVCLCFLKGINCSNFKVLTKFEKLAVRISKLTLKFYQKIAKNQFIQIIKLGKCNG